MLFGVTSLRGQHLGPNSKMEVGLSKVGLDMSGVQKGMNVADIPKKEESCGTKGICGDAGLRVLAKTWRWIATRAWRSWVLQDLQELL